jgi:Nickel responsive protein SCO4226-like
MPSFIVEQYLPGVTLDQVLAAAARAKHASARLSGGGVPVRYLRTTYIPEDESCFSTFEGPDASSIRDVNEIAEIPFERIVEAVDVSADELV